MNISFGYDYKGFSGGVSMLYKTDVFTKTDLDFTQGNGIAR